MTDPTLIMAGLIAGLVVLSIVVVPLLYSRLYKKVASGQALIVNKISRVEVSFTGGLVMPVVHRAEVMDISVKQIDIERKGKSGVVCRDDIRADMKMTFFVRVNKTAEDVIKVAQAIGAERASRVESLEELFAAKFSDAAKAVVRQLDFVDLYSRRDELKDQILQVVGTDLNGYVLDDLAIDYLEQTPIEMLDSHNVLDASGIRKITEITSGQEIRTAERRNEATRRIAELEIEAKELFIEIERRQADALGRLRADTGRDLTVEQLEEQLAERLKTMVDLAVKERLGREG